MHNIFNTYNFSISHMYLISHFICIHYDYKLIDLYRMVDFINIILFIYMISCCTNTPHLTIRNIFKNITNKNACFYVCIYIKLFIYFTLYTLHAALIRIFISIINVTYNNILYICTRTNIRRNTVTRNIYIS